MEDNCFNSGFYRTQEEPIHDPSVNIGHIESIIEREEQRKDKESSFNSCKDTCFQI